MIAHFSETLGGLDTIRAFRAQSQFTLQFHERMEKIVVIELLRDGLNRWLAIRLQFLGALTVALSAALTIIGRSSIEPGLAGLSLTYAMSLSACLGPFINQITWTEMEMNSVCSATPFASLFVLAH